MAATVPMRYTDLVHKYGWDVMPRLASLGIQNLAEAQFLFVDSGATSTLDADDGVHGHSLEQPLATIDYAVGLCTASEQSVILVAPGHAETKAAASALVTCDVIGTKIIGVGVGSLRPTLTLSTDIGAIAFSVTAANVVISNFKILVTKDAVTKTISVAAASCKLEDIEVVDNASSTEAAIGVLTSAAATDLVVERYIHNGWLAGDACTEAISLVGVVRATIKDSWFRGKFSLAAVNLAGTLSTGIVVDHCLFENGTTALTLDVVDSITQSKWSVLDCFDVVGGYKFSGGSGNALATDDVSALAAAVAVVDANADKIDSATLAVAPTAGSLARFVASGGIALGTQLPSSTSLYDTTKIVNTVGVTATPVANTLADIFHKDGSFTYDNTTDSLEALADQVSKIDGVTLDTTPVAASLATFVAGGAGGQGSQLPTSKSLYDVVKNVASLACVDITDAVDMTAEVVDNSILANVLTVEGDTSDYDRRYYSLQALAKILQLQMGYMLKSVPGSAMPIAIWYVDANISSSGDGKTPLTAFKTMDEAITVCTSTADDWILVFDYSGGGGTITVNQPFVHIIGNACVGMPYPRIKPATAVPGFTLGDAADRVEIANLVIGGGDQTVAGILFNGAAGSYGCYIHDNVICRDADAPGLYGIHVGAGADAPYLVVENNRFYGSDGAGIVATGSAIRIQGNMTRGCIRNNYIQDVGRTATPAIWLDGTVVNPQIENNRIKTDTDTGTGSAITLSANVDDGWIAGNMASDGKDAPAQNPFVDGGSTNGWGMNWQGIVAVLPA